MCAERQKKVTGKPRALAFVMPQTVRGSEAPRGFLTSIRKIEDRTGLDFFTELEHDQEERLEAEAAEGMW